MNSASDQLPKYSPSGRLALRTIPVVLLLGIPVALLCGWIYGQLMATSEWIPLSIFISAFAGTVIALCIAGVMRYSRSRSVKFNKYTAAMLGVVVIWARWITTLREHGMVDAATDFATSGPLGWLQILAGFLTQSQAATTDPTWWPLVVAGWLLEGVFLVSIISTLSRFSAEEAFSEATGQPAKKDFEGELFWRDGHSGALLEMLQQYGASVLLDFERAAGLGAASVSSQWWTLRVTGKSVKSDASARWLDLDVLVHSRDEKGKISSKSTPLMESLHISDADYAALANYLTGESVGNEELVTIPHENSESTDAPPAQRPTPPELEPAVTALEAANYSTALALAQPHCLHPDDAVRADAHRMFALANARLQQWQLAFEHYHNLFELEPTAFNAMQLATTSVTAGQLLRGHAWFEKAEQINRDTSEVRQPLMRTQYLSALEQAGELAAAKPHLDWLADAYRLARTSDDHQLCMYGLPFFQVFLEKSLPILRACCSEADLRAWYASMREDLDDGGRDALDRHLASLA